VNAREFLVVLAATALFLVMGASFLGNVNWLGSPTSIPVYNTTSNNGIANQMFEGFAMIGGVYLAKMDEPGKVGP